MNDQDVSAGDPWSIFQNHETVLLQDDHATGLCAVISIHSTALGPSLGGVRMSDYQHAGNHAQARAAAYADAMRLSRAMTYKNALAGLPHGGGKAVIVHDATSKTPELLSAFGTMINRLDGRYITAGDVGMSVADMDVIAETCPWTTGRSPDKGGLGDSGILTAVGVHAGMRAGAQVAFGTSDLGGKSVVVVGTGKVGGRLIGHLLGDGARVIAIEPLDSARSSVEGEHSGQIEWVEDLETALALRPDVLSPNALGGILTSSSVQDLARSGVGLVSGGANNQLISSEVADELVSLDIVYTPDFCVNCGGVVQVAEELAEGDLARARSKVESVFDTTLAVLQRASADGINPVQAAEREAEARITSATPTGPAVSPG